MLRKTLLALLLLFTAFTASAQLCDLSISVTCDATSCHAVTTNVGTNTCMGDYFSGFFAGVPTSQVHFSNFSTSLGLEDCFDSSDFDPSDESEPFVFCFGTAALSPGQSFNANVNVTASTGAPSTVPIIGIAGVLDDLTEEELAFVYAFNDLQTPTCTPSATVPSIAQSNTPYDVVWSNVSNAQTSFIIDESTSPDFTANLTTRTVQGNSARYQHQVAANTTYYYRVRASFCSTQPGPNSGTISIVVQAPKPPVTSSGTSRVVDNVVPFGSTTPFSFSLFIPPPTGGAGGKLARNATTSFSVATDKPYLTVSPSSGTVGANGTTVTVTTDPSGLPPGANTGTVNVTGDGGQSLGNIPVSVSLATPVSQAAKSLPPGNALIIPVVTHVNGGGGPFQSDVRLTNSSSAGIKYQVTYTPTRTDGTKSSKSTQITVDGGQTIALNDIVKDFFGVGATGTADDAGAGSLEIRPLNTSSTLTYASSRTFVTTGEGTLGQFIPATPFTKFATNASMLPLPNGPAGLPILSLQQIAQSSKFRTNLGIVEGSGTPASGNIRIFDDNGTLLRSVPYSLQPGEHQQLNSFLAANGITLDDGRIEISVDSATGAVSAYASVLDNLTTDPLAVSPVQTSLVSATRFILPGMANLQSLSNFHSDIRVYNGGSTSVTVTPKYYPQNNGTPVSATPFTIGAGQVKAIDDVLPTLFNVTGSGGSIILTTPSPSSLVATGRTYSVKDNGGTYGQFIPGVTPAEGIGVGDRPLQLLQLEQSNLFRTNLGLAELTGNPVDLRITLTLPDSKVQPFITQHLEGNQFQQIGVILSGLNPGQNTYNGRLTIAVTGGTGRVTAYGSVIDNVTQDPTYVPAQ